MKTIAWDFDETLFWTNRSWLHALELRTGFKAKWYDIKNWDFTPAVPAELRPQLMACRTPELYETCWPAPDALDAVRILHLKGYNQIVVTQDSIEFVEVKRRLIRWFFPMLVGKIVIAKDKWAAAKFDILVDDAAHNNPTFLVARPWNEAAAEQWGDRRVSDLREVARRLK